MFKMQLNNVYAIDSMMFGYPHYASCYLIKGKELAMVDTGMPERLDDVLAGIKAHGFNVEDISKIFVTHCEHPDHSGNVASILELAPDARVYCNPIGEKNLLDPGIQHRERMKTLPPFESRNMLEDGSFGGRTQRSDNEMLAIWNVAVEETRSLLEAW